MEGHNEGHQEWILDLLEKNFIHARPAEESVPPALGRTTGAKAPMASHTDAIEPWSMSMTHLTQLTSCHGGVRPSKTAPESDKSSDRTTIGRRTIKK